MVRDHMKGCLGGTFDVLHDGHMLLFRKAFSEFSELVVGITSDEMASKKRQVTSYDERKACVITFLEGECPIPYTIEKLEDPYGPALESEMEGIVVSEETKPNAVKINVMRVEKGLDPLAIFTIGLLKKDGKKLSARNLKYQ